MLVNVYIEIIRNGRFECCDGTYACVLEVDWNGRPVNKNHYGAWTDSTIQRLQLRACITAMEHIIKESEVMIHINAPAVAAMFETKSLHNKGKNADLWDRLKELCEPHLVTVCHEKETICSAALRTELKDKVLEYKRDIEMSQERLG